MTERKDLDQATGVDEPPERRTGSKPKEPHGRDMADVIEGPVGFASIVDPQRNPEREGTLPESSLEDDVERERADQG